MEMEIIIYIVGALICYLVSTMIHEMGHVACGLLHHWKLYMLVVGPVKLYRETMDSKLKIGIEKNPILWCGVGGTLPQKESEENVNALHQNRRSDAEEQFANMERIRDKVAKVIVDDCKKKNKKER